MEQSDAESSFIPTQRYNSEDTETIPTDIDAATTQMDGSEAQSNSTHSEEEGPQGEHVNLPEVFRGRVRTTRIQDDARGKNVVATLTEPLEESQYHPELGRNVRRGKKTLWIKKTADRSTQDAMGIAERMM